MLTTGMVVHSRSDPVSVVAQASLPHLLMECSGLT